MLDRDGLLGGAPLRCPDNDGVSDDSELGIPDSDAGLIVHHSADWTMTAFHKALSILGIPDKDG